MICCVNCMKCVNHLSCSNFSNKKYFPEYCAFFVPKSHSILLDVVFYEDHFISCFDDLCELGLDSTVF